MSTLIFDCSDCHSNGNLASKIRVLFIKFFCTEDDPSYRIGSDVCPMHFKIVILTYAESELVNKNCYRL